jgi:hypothetical protein
MFTLSGRPNYKDAECLVKKRDSYIRAAVLKPVRVKNTIVENRPATYVNR